MGKIYKFSAILAVTIVLLSSCVSKNTTSFAIFVDSETYSLCTEKLNAYRDVLKEEGLNAMIISSDWQSPDQIKDTILYLRGQKPTLEGVVFVGNIPIVKVLGGQHMTTAFKMNERIYPKKETGVTSDRFYDDFDLDFEFDSRDSLESNVFYYRLTEKGTQSISSDIYSARIIVPSEMKGDHTEMLNAYLDKVVAAHKENNPFDKLIFFAGQGYNSDCLTIWRQKPIIWREYFPTAFEKASNNKIYNFRQDPKIKFKLFNELQRTDIDLFMFSEHGDYDTQFINGSEEGENLTSNIKLLKESLQRYYKRYYKGTPEEEGFIKEVMADYWMPRSIFSAAELKKTQDSYPRLDDTNIVLEEIEKLKTGPRMVIFDACYNGSFYQKGYVAGYHIFNGGKCVVTQGNTVNVLQDKWEDQLIGYLSRGIRAGLWQKEFRFLESHMVGDPTFRFSSFDAKSDKLYAALTNGKKNTCYWRMLLKDEDPLYRAAAIKHLGEGISSSKLLKIFSKDESPIVRQQALEALSEVGDANLTKAVALGLFDRFEVVRVKAATHAGDIGDTSLLPLLIKSTIDYPEALRSKYIASLSISIYPSEVVEEALKEFPEADAKGIMKSINRMENELKVAMDTTAGFGKREGSVRTFRNYNIHYGADDLLKILGNPNEDMRLRKIVCETLGWYVLSVEREMIISTIEGFLSQPDLDPILSTRMKKTIARLR